ncbi:MAG: hypothetical protein ACQSGP_20335 [Frankia sp.]
MAAIAALIGDLDTAIDRNITLHGVLIRPDGPRLAVIAGLLETGALRTMIRAEHPLADLPRRTSRSGFGGTPGKTVLRIQPESGRISR